MKDDCQFDYWLTLVRTDYYRCLIHDEVVSERQLSELTKHRTNTGQNVTIFKPQIS